MPSGGARYTPELMDDASRCALMGTLERLLSSELLEQVWPAAFDRKQEKNGLSHEEIDIVVLPLDRIGAPPGASGARVFVAYYSHRESSSASRCLASPPLVVKMGSRDKLLTEIDFRKSWPTLGQDIRARFAMPIKLDDTNPDIAVLIAPFRSRYAPDQEGLRNGVGVVDLWSLLHKPEELKAVVEWRTIENCIAQALAAMDAPHRNNKATYSRSKTSYYRAYDWYLRNTYAPPGAQSDRGHIPELIFGKESHVAAFGRRWPNPVSVISDIMDPSIIHEATVGAVHGDLHPKNIVLGHSDVVQIIDFGWSCSGAPVVVDYLLLDLNLRGTTLPSQLGEQEALAIGNFLDESQDPSGLHPLLIPRARLIKEQIWRPLREKKIVLNWSSEYLIPFFIIAYGLLVYLDAARNQPAMIASVLHAADRIRRGF
jgi:Ternary complex associated domain 9